MRVVSSGSDCSSSAPRQARHRGRLFPVRRGFCRRHRRRALRRLPVCRHRQLHPRLIRKIRDRLKRLHRHQRQFRPHRLRRRHLLRQQLEMFGPRPVRRRLRTKSQQRKPQTTVLPLSVLRRNKSRTSAPPRKRPPSQELQRSVLKVNVPRPNVRPKTKRRPIHPSRIAPRRNTKRIGEQRPSTRPHNEPRPNDLTPSGPLPNGLRKRPPRNGPQRVARQKRPPFSRSTNHLPRRPPHPRHREPMSPAV